jgi:hypothetical protein
MSCVSFTFTCQLHLHLKGDRLFSVTSQAWANLRGALTPADTSRFLSKYSYGMLLSGMLSSNIGWISVMPAFYDR